MKASVVLLLIAVVAFLASTTLPELWSMAATVLAAFSAVGALLLFAVNRSRPAD